MDGNRGGAQRLEPRPFQFVAIKKIVGVKGDQAAIGVDNVDTGLLHRAHVECVSVEKLDDKYSKNILIAQISWCGNTRETAKQIAQRGRAGFGRMVGGKQVEEAIADPRLFFIDDRIARAVDQNLWLNHAGEG